MAHVALLLAALWWGGISGLSFVAVPTLFAKLGAPAVAGPVAAQLFSYQCRAGVLIGLVLLVLLQRLRQRELGADGAPTPGACGLTLTIGAVLLAMVLALVQEFGVAPRILTARATGASLPFWHGLGSVLVLGQWLCAGTILWRVAGRFRG